MNIMKRTILTAAVLFISGLFMAVNAQKHTIPFENGTLTLTSLQDNAVRIRYSEGKVKELPEWIYTEPVGKVKCKKTVKGGKTVFRFDGMTVTAGDGKVEVMDKEGRTIFSALSHELENASVQGEPTKKAKLEINSPEDEFLFGLGQFQDGYLNVKGLTRRLTQVNTQIIRE